MTTERSIKDTLTVRCLVEAFQEAAEAERQEKEARENYDGYSWGYHGHRFIERRERAAEKLQRIFDEYIDQRIEAATGARP